MINIFKIIIIQIFKILTKFRIKITIYKKQKIFIRIILQKYKVKSKILINLYINL
jgi:hypothetical protein